MGLSANNGTTTRNPLLCFQHSRSSVAESPISRLAGSCVEEAKGGNLKGRHLKMGFRSEFSLNKSLCGALSPGEEKLTRSSLKGFFSRALFAYKNGHFASSLLLLGIGLL